MKKFLLAAASVAAFASAASAADLPSRRAPPVYVPPPPAPTFTWTGLYAGFNVGGTFNDYTNYRLFGNDAGTATTLALAGRPAFLSTRASGFAGGGQVGYNFQLNDGLFGSFAGAIGNGISPIFGGNYGGVVAGIEADIDGTTARETNTFAGSVGPSQFQSRVDFVGTVRGRVGYAFGNLLIFGTGGFGYAGVRDNTLLFNAAGVQTLGGNFNKLQTGVAYGGGVEYAIPTSSFVNFFKASAVTVKAEFIHYDLSSSGVLVLNPTTGVSYNERVRNLGNIARVGVNYKFGSPAAAPVVARY